MPKGSVVTFYSYKGGVGRTFVLANVAAALARWGYRVLCIDWDLEAPGLASYFESWTPHHRRGLLDLIEMMRDDASIDWSALAIDVKLPQSIGRLTLIPAGSNDQAYVARVQALDWGRLYREHNFGSLLEQVRSDWIAKYDFVFIDSRTGISDIGGICTVQLPDILVFMFTANRQSLDGAVDVVRRAEDARNHLPYDRARLLAVPIPSRFETREEYKLAAEWQSRFVNVLSPFYSNWAEIGTEVRELLERTTIPYYSFWSFGERLPIEEEKSRGPDYISYYLETVAALIAHQLSKSNLLIESRDSYVGAASRQGQRRGTYNYDAFLSYSATDKAASWVALELARSLESSAVRVWHDERQLEAEATGARTWTARLARRDT